MGRFLNPDNIAFQRAVNSEIYVDKTGLLEYTNSVMDTLQAFICSSRPRRFGKSVTADMLTAYYSRGCDSGKLFSSYEISKKVDFDRYRNQCNVIHLDIQWFLTTVGEEELLSRINESVLEELRRAFPSVNLKEEHSLPSGLSRIYGDTGERFVVIIDEWDALIRDTKADPEIQDTYIDFLCGMFKGTEPARFIRLAYLTGILPIKKLKTESALNNFDEFTMLYPGRLARYIGFTAEEVQALCREYGGDYDRIRQWYDGYRLGEYEVYNPRAVIGVIQTGEYRSYWSSTGTYESVVPFINQDFDGRKASIMEMLSGSDVPVNTRTFQNNMVGIRDRDDVLTLLIHLGYLAYRQEKRTAYIPNEEIRLELLDAVRARKWTALQEFERESEQLLDATLDGDEREVAAGIEKIHEQYTSILQYNNENALSSVLTLAYLSTLQYYFRPIRELPTGRGFADFVYLPKPEYKEDYPALVAELKWNKTVKTALDQIQKKHYPESIRQYTGDILLVGINYDKKTKRHECRIEKVEE